MRGVNLTRFGEASVDLEHKEDTIQRFSFGAIALDLERTAGWAGGIAPCIARQILTERYLAA